MKFSKQTWLNLSCKMWKQREKEMRKGSPVSILLPSVVFPEAVFQKTSAFWNVSQIYLVRLPGKQQCKELHLLLLCICGMKGSCASFVGNMQTQCLEPWLILWIASLKGKSVSFPFGRVTSTNYSCVLTLTSPQLLYSQTNIFIHINHLAFVLATSFWLLHILNILKLQIFLLEKLFYGRDLYRWFFFPLSPIKVGCWGKKSLAWVFTWCLCFLLSELEREQTLVTEYWVCALCNRWSYCIYVLKCLTLDFTKPSVPVPRI